MTADNQVKKSKNKQKHKGDGWFILHASEAPWLQSDRFGFICNFEGQARFPHIGVNIHVVQPDQPTCLYHRENAQENFFILSGECMLLIEDEEHRLKAGHFVHCPPQATHVFIGAGDKPCAILMIGYRPPEKKLCYPVSALAAKHGASANRETTDPREAYKDSPAFKDAGESFWPLY